MRSNKKGKKFLAKKVISAIFPKTVVYSYGNPSKDGRIALTFDDGPHTEFTPKILSILESKNVKATFFLTGEGIKDNPELAKEIKERGHQIGNHTYLHRRLSLLSYRGILNEINKNNSLIQEVVGERPDLFRPPFGEVTPAILLCSLLLRMRLIFWSFDSEDYRDESVANIRKRFENISAGDIVLFHEDYQHTPEVLPLVISDLLEKRLRFVTIGDMLKK
jgi:peptidoglycan-N-acetylglucosamine deacetylase